jgi:hypothetical protein
MVGNAIADQDVEIPAGHQVQKSVELDNTPDLRLGHGQGPGQEIDGEIRDMGIAALKAIEVLKQHSGVGTTGLRQIYHEPRDFFGRWYCHNWNPSAASGGLENYWSWIDGR